MKSKILKALLLIAIIISPSAAYLSILNIGLTGNPLPARTPMFLIKPILGKPDKELYYDETGKTFYIYENINIWGEKTYVKYGGILWIDEIHTSFEPSGDSAQKYNEIFRALQKVYSEESSTYEQTGVRESHMMRRGPNIFDIILYDTGLISLSLYIY